MEYVVNSSSFGEYVHGSCKNRSYVNDRSDGYNEKTEDLDDFQPDSEIMRCLTKLEELAKKECLKVHQDYYPEAYGRFELMASVAIHVYNQQSHTSLFVGDILSTSSLPAYPTRTRLMFTAIDGSYTKPVQTFQAEVDGCIKYGLEVISCNPIL